MIAALIRIFEDISDIHKDRCCAASAAAPLTLRDGLLPPTHTNSHGKKHLHVFFISLSIFSHETSPLKKRIFRHTKPLGLGPAGPSVLDRFKEQLQLL